MMNLYLFKLINDQAGQIDWLDGVMIFAAKWLIYLIGLGLSGLLIYLAWHGKKRIIALILFSIAISYLLLVLLSSLSYEHRPFVEHSVNQLLPHAANDSFPSDHAAASLAMALPVLFFASNRCLGALLTLLALGVCYGRIFTGMHYPRDVLTSLLIVLLSCALVYTLNRRAILSRSAR